MKCVQCGRNNQAPGAEPLCGTCWAKSGGVTPSEWPGYAEVTQSLLATGKQCRVCGRKLYALPGDDREANICVDCA